MHRPVVHDALLAAALAGLGLVPTLSAIGVQLGDLPERPPDALSVTLLLAQCAPLALRRRRPAICLAVVGAALALDEVLGCPPTFASIGLYVALYSAGAYLERFRPAVAAAAASVGFAALAVTLSHLGRRTGPQTSSRSISSWW